MADERSSYLFGVGVTKYNNLTDLRYCVHDVEDVQHQLKRRLPNLKPTVIHSGHASSVSPTFENMEALLAEIGKLRLKPISSFSTIQATVSFAMGRTGWPVWTPFRMDSAL
jgi:hypothetical protein